MKKDSKIISPTFLTILGMTVLFTHDDANARSFADYAHQESVSINHTMRFDNNSANNHLTVFNVNGSIDVEGHDGDEVSISATQMVAANSQELVTVGLQEIGLKHEQQGDRIYVYLDSPFTYFNRDEGLIWHSDTCWRRNDCSRKSARPKDYKYHMDITVRIPMNTSIKISTINHGDIGITGVEAKSLDINNINGAIDMVDVAGQTRVNAINRDINISYSRNPQKDSSYESINGDLNINYAGQPNAEVVYQTMHGELYTAYDVSLLAPHVKRTSEQKKHGIQYKLDAESRLKIGTGGPEYRFQTLNGDIKIQRQ